ncbi:putative transcriptional regulatory protein YkoG [Paenibacillus sp. J31TS4]|uniref:response regulator transcription factor n=1 Tax=Paenibacillus sp. J31TS4 TaxID=2807195 RepID=UPI001B06CB2D|nr:response regulator transcription factor [Paenibacillus sp. J31TS4]GIP38137.1 putative transcriptional regulatory protein YkoG [Paenibacillus sp. J31TS4]
MKPRILVIEDETKIARVLVLELTHEQYETDTAETGREGLDKAMHAKWDLILLDVMLPEMNGLEVLRRLRQSGSRIPVILLTARDSTPDVVAGLDLGANDYITKPFEIEELLARIRAVLRMKETERSAPEELAADGLVVHPESREVIRGGTRIELTPKEYDLLLYLLKNKNKALSRDEIIREVWGFDFVGDTNLVDVYIRYLRKKMDYGFGCPLIQTVRGVGYSLRETDNEAEA